MEIEFRRIMYAQEKLASAVHNLATLRQVNRTQTRGRS